MLGIGGVAAVAGVVVLVLGRRDVSKSRAQLTPSVSPKMAGATFRLSF